MSNAVILFSHGSLLCGSDKLLKMHAGQLRLLGPGQVEIGFLNYSKPSIEEAVQRCVSAGADSITIMPYFLVAGKFVTEDLPRRLEAVRMQWPGVQLIMARPIEDAPPMIDAILDSAMKAEPVDDWQKRAILESLESCESRSDCPLYGTEACKMKAASHE